MENPTIEYKAQLLKNGSSYSIILYNKEKNESIYERSATISFFKDMVIVNKEGEPLMSKELPGLEVLFPLLESIGDYLSIPPPKQKEEG